MAASTVGFGSRSAATQRARDAELFKVSLQSLVVQEGNLDGRVCIEWLAQEPGRAIRRSSGRLMNLPANLVFRDGPSSRHGRRRNQHRPKRIPKSASPGERRVPPESCNAVSRSNLSGRSLLRHGKPARPQGGGRHQQSRCHPPQPSPGRLFGRALWTIHRRPSDGQGAARHRRPLCRAFDGVAKDFGLEMRTPRADSLSRPT
jgi:hypothetical protein